MEKCRFCGSYSIELTKQGYVCKKCGKSQEQARKQYTSPFGEEYSKDKSNTL